MMSSMKKGLIVITSLSTLFLNVCYYSIFYFILYKKLDILLSEVTFYGGFVCVTINVMACYLYAERKYKQRCGEKEKNVQCLLLSIINTVVHVVGSYIIGEILEWSVMENYGMYYYMLNIWIMVLMCIMIFFNFMRYGIMNLGKAKD